MRWSITVIAWDGRTLVADKRCCVGGLVRTVTKIHRVGGLLVGGSGELSFILAMVEWVRGGRLAEKYPADQRNKDDYQPVLVIEADGTPSIYERTPHPIRYEDPFCAMGSGRDYAMAAMHLGKTAREAVEVACALDAGCGNGIDCIELGQWSGAVLRELGNPTMEICAAEFNAAWSSAFKNNGHLLKDAPIRPGDIGWHPNNPPGCEPR